MAFEATPAPAPPVAAAPGSEACARHGACWPSHAARCSSWPYSPRSRSALRAVAWRPRTPRSSTSPALTHPLRRPRRRAASPRSPAGTPSGTSASPTRATARATCARPSSRSIRCWSAGWASSAGGSAGALLLAAYAGLAGGVPRRRSCCSTGWSRSSWARRWPPPTLLLLAVFPGALFFGAPYSESLFLLLSVGAFYARPHRPLGLGRRLRGGARGHAAARGSCCSCPLAIFWWSARPRRVRDAAWLLLAPLGSRPTRRYLGSPRATGCASSRSRRPGRGSSPGPSWAPGTGCVAAVDGVRQLALRAAHARVLRGGRRRPVPGGGA